MTASKSEETNYQIEAVDFAVRTLSTISAEPDLSMSEIARRLGGSRQRMLRMLRTLEASDMIERGSDNKSYRLGFRALLIGNAAREQSDISRLAEPLLARMGEAVQETVQLRLRDGADAVCVAKWEPTQKAVRVHAAIGRKRPLHVGSGKVFLAYMPEEEKEAYLSAPLVRFTEKTVTEPELLRQRLSEIRRDGYLVSQGELSPDMVAIAAPVFDASGNVAACINIGAPSARTDTASIELMRDQVLSSAQQLSQQLGWTGLVNVA